ncbi:MAG: ribonuclease R, partial [Gammaproteobacteria bacterium]
RGFGIVVPESKRVQHELLIPSDEASNAQDGQFVLAEILDYPSNRRKATARIAEVLGDVTTPGLEIDVAVRSHDIPHQFSKAVTKEADTLPNDVSDLDCQGRFDLTDIPFVTIDGEDAKDFDDAVFAHRHQRGNYTLYVAIADVSHYVRPASPLDEEAVDRGTSVYFPGHVIPMLPEKLSNGLCSLKPEVDRLAMVCEMEIAADGEMTDYSFYEAVIHSHGRLTYNEVSDMVTEPDSETGEKIQERMRQKYKSVTEHLDNLYSLYNVLRINRSAGGSLDLDTVETRIVFGEDRKIREIIPVERNDAHRLIEECMLRANVAAATLLSESKLPVLYRVHQGPNEEKLENFREYLAGQGLHLGGGAKPTPTDYSHLLQHIASRADRHVLQTMLIRSMMQAVYQPENIGHFGLNFELYTHFTSPIRRYPDLLVHRAIRFLIGRKSSRHAVSAKDGRPIAKEKIYPYSAGDMQNLGVSCSAAERRADAASYDVIDWLKCEYMEQHVGDDFDGVVAAVTSFGLFVELENVYIEGLVHITELSNDYYHFDPVHHCLEGERTRQTYRLGDRVRVKVIRVSREEKKIDLRMLGGEGTGKKNKPGKKGRHKTGKKPSQPSSKPGTARKRGRKRRK